MNMRTAATWPPTATTTTFAKDVTWRKIYEWKEFLLADVIWLWDILRRFFTKREPFYLVILGSNEQRKSLSTYLYTTYILTHTHTYIHTLWNANFRVESDRLKAHKRNETICVIGMESNRQKSNWWGLIVTLNRLVVFILVHRMTIV